ncbi:peptidase M38 [Brachybacterium endophyticum]|uniref:Peptidase M38 n=1 Tax=Brachybacterium endophyticum TaxID=2182385 RepID=A0A2U2RPS2_9MICO|nr:peptidase M38 [Brachybacterium endophyticum]
MRNLVHAPAVFTNAHHLDVATGDWRTADLHTSEGRFSALHDSAGADAGTTRVRTGADDSTETVDLADYYVIPGLIDCHVHVYAMSANLAEVETEASSYAAMQAARLMGDMLDRGFTTVRDTGGADHGLARAQAEGLLRGPRLFFGGKALSQTGGHGDSRRPGQHVAPSPSCCSGLGMVADGADAVRQAARDQLRTGADHVKIMAGGGVASPTDRVDSIQYSIAEMRAAVEEARDANRYVAAHAYTPGAISRALEAGVRSIEHANLIDRETARKIRDADAFVTMNLVTYWALKELGAQAGLPEASQRKVDDVLEAGENALRIADEEDLQLCFGTDLLGSMQAHQSKEFEIRARHQEPLAILKAATLTAAKLLRREGELGVIGEGAQADFVVLDRDPLQDITALSEPDPVMVVQGGRIVSRRNAN